LKQKYKIHQVIWLETCRSWLQVLG
jgi:hypothetical protein